MAQENQLENYTAAIDAKDSETAIAVAEQPEQIEAQPETSNEVEDYRRQRSPKKRIDKLTAEKYELQQRAERAEQRARELEAKQSQRADGAQSEPAAHEQPQSEQKDVTDVKTSAGSETENNDARLAAVRSRHSDFEDAIKNAAARPIPNTIVFAAQQADNKEEIAYFLAKNPQIADELMTANPTAVEAREYIRELSQNLHRVHAEQDFKRFIADNPQYREKQQRIFEAGRQVWEDKEWQALAKSNPNRFEVGRHVIAALYELENGPALGVHLLRNPDICDRLRGMSPQRAIAELGRLSAEINKKPERSESKAPPPITPVGSSSQRSIEYSDEMSVEDYDKYRRNGGGR